MDNMKHRKCSYSKQKKCNCTGEDPKLTLNGVCIFTKDPEGRPKEMSDTIMEDPNDN